MKSIIQRGCLFTSSRIQPRVSSTLSHTLTINQTPIRTSSTETIVEANPTSATSGNGIQHVSITDKPDGVLVRDFVRESLYAESGYFNSSRVINSPGVINFSQLLGRSQYEKRLNELYYSGVQGWSTPVEIFQPYYAQSLARWMLSHVVPSINQNSYISEEALEKAMKHSDKGPSTGSEYGVGSIVDKKTPSPRNKRAAPGDKPVPEVVKLDTAIESMARRFGKDLKTKDNTVGNINIYEIGAGNGTCAVNILNFLRTYYPNVYKNTQYNIIEMSESLSWQQKELLDGNHDNHYHVHNINAAEWKTPCKEHAFVFGLEVLDNMPHDKVVLGSDGNYYQVMVAVQGTEIPEITRSVPVDASLLNVGTATGFIEYAVPINDEIIQKCLDLYTSYLTTRDSDVIVTKTETVSVNNSSKQKKPVSWFYKKFVDFAFKRKFKKINTSIIYLPTECLRFLQVLDTQFPKHTLMLADFDYLPSTEAKMGVNGPVVAHKSEDAASRGKTKDENTYLVTLGTCDIFYPTDFGFLKHMYSNVVLKNQPSRDQIHHFGLQQPDACTTTTVTNPSVSETSRVTPVENVSTVITQFDFLWKYAETRKTECKNGFNPMLEDYTNMAMFVGSRN